VLLVDTQASAACVSWRCNLAATSESTQRFQGAGHEAIHLSLSATLGDGAAVCTKGNASAPRGWAALT
jgi:hypothetical protein